MAYTVSITLDTPRPQRVSRDLAIMTGQADLTSYNSSQASAEITSITGKFKTTKTVIGGTTDNGYVVQWDRSTGTFVAFDVGTSAGAMQEVSNSTDVGAFSFMAVGMV